MKNILKIILILQIVTIYCFSTEETYFVTDTSSCDSGWHNYAIVSKDLNDADATIGYVRSQFPAWKEDVCVTNLEQEDIICSDNSSTEWEFSDGSGNVWHVNRGKIYFNNELEGKFISDQRRISAEYYVRALNGNLTATLFHENSESDCYDHYWRVEVTNSNYEKINNQLLLISLAASMNVDDRGTMDEPDIATGLAIGGIVVAGIVVAGVLYCFGTS